MANDDYFSEGKYRCNHPESDFKDSSKGPIEMKKENFVEYTHRNETANYRHDVWSSNDNTSKSFNSTSSSMYNSSNSQYSQNKNYNTTTSNYSKSVNLYNSYNKNSTKKKPPNIGCLIIILIYGLPFIFGIIGAIFGMIAELF